MTKPESYPFLRISREYGVDYSVVLSLADQLRLTQRAAWEPAIPPDLLIDIGAATDVQEAIREGEIDWQTGEDIFKLISPIDRTITAVGRATEIVEELHGSGIGCPHCGYRHPPDGMCI